MNDQEYTFLKEKILKLTGLNLDGYKSQQIRRRLEGFVNRSTGNDVIGYCRMLEREPEHRRELVDYLAINVSEFFRDTQHFHYLKNTVLPLLAKDRERLRIWSAACSCGQEPYSIAMLLEESAAGRYRILATDIDASALERAKSGGPYTASDIRNVEKGLLQLYFRQDKDGYRVDERLKTRIEFSRHNLLSDDYRRGFDLVVCRNAIIYFSDRVREEMYHRFFRSLNPGGVLFIGGSEAILRPDTIGFSLLRPSFYCKSKAGMPLLTPVKVLERR